MMQKKITDIKGLVLVSIFIFFSCNQQPSPKEIVIAGTGQEALQSVLNQIADDRNLPGLAAAVVDSSGVKFIAAAGKRKINAPDSLTTEDLFHLGSCTKAMTSVMLSVLIREGLLSWESTLAEVFPQHLQDINPYYHDVTLHQLVTHRGGVPANAANWRNHRDEEMKKRRNLLMLENLNEKNGEKGEYLYSNLGYMIAGHMAEEVTGKTWESLMQELVFEPLQMEDVGFGPPGTKDSNVQPRGHRRLFKWIPLFADNPAAMGPAGTVHASLEEWAKFVGLWLQRSDTSFLTAREREFLITPVGDYACGWLITEREWAGGIALNHAGSNTMWLAVAWVAPEKNIAFLVTANAYGDAVGDALNDVVTQMIKMELE